MPLQNKFLLRSIATHATRGPRRYPMPSSPSLPNLKTLLHWLQGEDLPKKIRVTRLRKLSARMREYAELRPSAELDLLIAKVEFKLHDLEHGEMRVELEAVDDPFEGVL